VTIEGNAESLVNEGRVCPKGTYPLSSRTRGMVRDRGKNDPRQREACSSVLRIDRPGPSGETAGAPVAHVVYDMPEGMPIGAGHFEGLQEILERFLTSFYGALDVHFVAEEFIAGREAVVAMVGSKERRERLASRST
jgi:hypothetical protein